MLKMCYVYLAMSCVLGKCFFVFLSIVKNESLGQEVIKIRLLVADNEVRLCILGLSGLGLKS